MARVLESPFVFTGTAFIIWRIGLIILAWLAPIFIPIFGERFPYRADILLKPYYESWFWVWGNFDGVHYLRIAKEGYAAEFSQAFFPAYPTLIGILGRIFANEFVIAGFLISNLAFVTALFLFFKLASNEFDLAVVKKTIIFLLIFPTSFYFGAIYTEGLFLLLILASFYFAKKDSWFPAAIFGFFASLTRFIGIFLFPALILEYWLRKKTLRFQPSAFSLLLIPAGLVIYMIYLGLEFGNPFYFLTAQSVFGAERVAQEFVLFPQVVWRYLKIFFTVAPTTLPFYNALFEFVITISFLFLILISFAKTRISWATFSFLAFITPTLTGTFSSMPRYVLVSFSAFLVLAQIKNKYLISLIFLISCLLLLVSVLLFTRGYWVA